MSKKMAASVWSTLRSQCPGHSPSVAGALGVAKTNAKPVTVTQPYMQHPKASRYRSAGGLFENVIVDYQDNQAGKGYGIQNQGT